MGTCYDILMLNSSLPFAVHIYVVIIKTYVRDKQ